MYAPFCWLTMVPRASIVTIYIHTHCLHLLLDLRLQSKRICIGIRYTTQLQVYMLHLHVHNVLSLYSILIPPNCLCWHFTKTSWPNQFHVVLSRNLPTQDQPCNHTARQAQATSPHDLFTFDSRGQLLSTRAAWRSHYSFWQLNSFAIAWNFSTTTFGKKWRYAHAIRMRLC